ncbi:hypothetical protein [Mesorhizobium sp. LSJC285A00]|uniref:hypothetical protein n=1 Tax=Mesorhizobium sp. LSJC285A00 TaxID=1287338 RepID=UPI0004CE1A5E|nr:hypothetical protein [Mesorhizobium sp. LSJC285A00]
MFEQMRKARASRGFIHRPDAVAQVHHHLRHAMVGHQHHLQPVVERIGNGRLSLGGRFHTGKNRKHHRERQENLLHHDPRC